MKNQGNGSVSADFLHAWFPNKPWSEPVYVEIPEGRPPESFPDFV
jgi:hypothetical protein